MFIYLTLILPGRPGFMIVLSVHPDNYLISENTFGIILKPGIIINKIVIQNRGVETLICLKV
jgi:hypothetical protein